MSLESNGGRGGRRLRLGIVVLALSAAITAGCAGDKDKELKYVETPVDELYNKALDALSVKRFQEAAKRFDEVERQHPYSVWARRAMLMSAYSYYRSNKYDDAILAAKRFIQLHPGNRDVAYAYYLIGVSYYEQISDVGRDQKMTEEALKSLREVVRRFPNSDYARDARLKVDMTLDHLAGKEMAVGRWYLRRNQPLAAINRFTNVVRDYQTTTHVPEALLRLTEAYLTMGVYGEAKATAAVLGYNFPGSKWYEDAYDLLRDRNLKPDKPRDMRKAESQGRRAPAARPDPRAAAAAAPAPSFTDEGKSSTEEAAVAVSAGESGKADPSANGAGAETTGDLAEASETTAGGPEAGDESDDAAEAKAEASEADSGSAEGSKPGDEESEATGDGAEGSKTGAEGSKSGAEESEAENEDADDAETESGESGADDEDEDASGTGDEEPETGDEG